MPRLFHGRQAVSIENEALRVTVLKEGGHIAEVLHKKSGISPLWVPHWPSIEPSQFDPVKHPEFGGGADGRLLAGIMGHNLCLDIFGGPSDAEAAAGLTAHGEASVAEYAIDTRPGELVMEARLPMAALEVRRTLELRGDVVHIQERVRNLSACDRPIGWTQHVTLAPPFLRHGETEFPPVRPARRSSNRNLDRPTTFQRERSSIGRMLQPSTGRPLTFACTQRGPHRAPTPRTSTIRPARTRSLSHSLRSSSWRSATSGRRPTFRGWASGRKTGAASNHRGIGNPSHVEWNSACRRFRRHGVR